MSGDAENKAIIRQLYEEVWNKRRLELVDEIISPSHALHDPNATGSAVSPEAHKRLVTRCVTAFPALRFVIEDFFGENEQLAASWTISGSLKRARIRMPTTNNTASVDGLTIP